MKKTAHLILIALLYLFVGCNDNDNQRNPIPDARVYLSINTNGGRDGALAAPGGYVEYTKNSSLTQGEFVGFGGILAVRGVEPVGGTGYMNLQAYDMACPHEARPDIVIKPIPGRTDVAKCKGCGSEYNILSGGGFLKGTGPSKYNLKYYRVISEGDFIKFKITN